MGEVYRARDPRLGRDVAIKVLPAAFAADADRLHRLEREARAAAALNHPNIVTIHSVEQAGDLLFLTMEIIEGRSLAVAIPKGGLPLDELLEIAVPLTDAIAAAHAKGITHRDLKPANIMIAASDHDGRVKVLDFGLAKLNESSLPSASAMTALTENLTAEGRVLGTVAYMSLEQAAGMPIDARSDLFSLGVILYEMATGQRPFKGDSNITVLSAILKDTPPSVTAVNAAMPPELSRIIKHCLVKDSARRYQTAADLRNELMELKQELDAGSPAAVAAGTMPMVAGRAPTRWLLAVGAVVIAGALTAAYQWYRPREASDRLLFDRTFVQLTTQPGLEEGPTLSPDGKWIAFDGNGAGNADIYLQSVSGHNAINLTKDAPDDDTQPTFSPDGERIAFRSERGGGGIFVMGRTGESVRRVTDSGFSPAWSPDGTRLVFATAFPDPFNRDFSELWVVTVSTGEKRRLSDVAEGIQPSWSPHGQRIAYWTVQGQGRPQGQRDIWTAPADGPATPVTSDAALDWNPTWSPDGRFPYFSSDRGGSMNVWRIALDEVTGRVMGVPVALTTPSLDSRHPSVSADGRLVAYGSFGEAAIIQQVGFDPVAATTIDSPRTVVGGSRYLSHVTVSADGGWLAYYSRERQFNILINRSDGTAERQLTNDQAYDRNPTFSPDGEWIAFFSNRGSDTYQIWLIRPDGSGLRQATNDPHGAWSFNSWSPDGSRMVYNNRRGPDNFVFQPRKPWNQQTPQVFSGAMAGGLTFSPTYWSPDGKRLLGNASPNVKGAFAYSFDSGRITRLSEIGEEWGWLSDGRRLLVTDRGKLVVFDIESKTSHEILSIAPDDFDSVALSSDNRSIYFTRVIRQGDVWLMTLK